MAEDEAVPSDRGSVRLVEAYQPLRRSWEGEEVQERMIRLHPRRVLSTGTVRDCGYVICKRLNRA